MNISTNVIKDMLLKKENGKQTIYADTEIKGKLDVEGEVTFTGATGNGKIIHSTYPNAARIRVQNANQSTSA